MRRMTVGIALVLLLGACGADTMFNADGVELVMNVRSSLGFLIHAHKLFRESGYGATPEHGTDADRWWQELMLGLQGYGYAPERADPDDIKLDRYRPNITLKVPYGPHEYIYCSGMSGLVGACYISGSSRMEVPGNYTTSTLTERPRSQPLKHEMLHYWCHRWLGHDCVDKGSNHFHPAPDGSGRNLWDLTWDRASTAQQHQQYLTTYHGEYTPMDAAMYYRAHPEESGIR